MYSHVEGSVHSFTRRCIIAIQSLEAVYVSWPSEQEQKEISRRIQAESRFPLCIGFVDGTIFPFSNQPEYKPEDYYHRKGGYGLSAMIVCDDQKRIRLCYTGWPASAHDSRVFNNSPLGLQPDSFFHDGAYLLADSAYTSSATIVPAYKKPANSALSREQVDFNYKLSNMRVRIEHAIGILKGKFQSLKGLRACIRGNRDIQRLSYWIRACIVLHNIVLNDTLDEEWIDSQDTDEQEPNDEGSGFSDSAEDIATASTGQKREFVKFVVQNSH